MKKVIPFVIGVILLGCNSEGDVEPANKNTFMRYYGSQYSHIANLALEADNGYSLLSTIEIPTDNLGRFAHKIRFIHTDQYGNTIWEREYPSFEDVPVLPEQVGGYKASSFIILNSGYLIVGESINSVGISELLLLEIDFEGNVQSEKTIGLNSGETNASIRGRAVALDQSGDYIVLGNITGTPPNDMYVARLQANTYSPIWSREYGAGVGTVTNRIFVNPNQNLVWAGSVNIFNNNDIRMVVAPPNSQSSDLGHLYGKPIVDEEASDICETIGGYAIVGSTNEGGAQDIYLTRVSPSGKVLGEPIRFDFAEQNDQGNSICMADDGGLVILGTAESSTTKGHGRADYYVIKTDATGNKLWEKNYGGADTEKGASIRATTDGSFIIFGTTYYGDLGKLMLMKVDEDGNLN